MNCLDREIEAAVLLTVPIAPEDDSHVPMLRAMLTEAHERDATLMSLLQGLRSPKFEPGYTWQAKEYHLCNAYYGLSYEEIQEARAWVPPRPSQTIKYGPLTLEDCDIACDVARRMAYHTQGADIAVLAGNFAAYQRDARVFQLGMRTKIISHRHWAESRAYIGLAPDEIPDFWDACEPDLPDGPMFFSVADATYSGTVLIEANPEDQELIDWIMGFPLIGDTLVRMHAEHVERIA